MSNQKKITIRQALMGAYKEITRRAPTDTETTTRIGTVTFDAGNYDLLLTLKAQTTTIKKG